MTNEHDLHRADNRPLHVGIIGTGEVATARLLPALAKIEGVSLWSVLSRDRSRAKSVAEKFGARAPEGAHTARELFLNDADLDAVIIATPDDLHAGDAIAAAHAGKHVFVEKPMATSVPDAERMIAVAKEHAVTLAVGYHLRHHRGHQALKEALEGGAVGTPKHIDITWTYAAPENDWRGTKEHGGWWSLAAVGTHAIDLATWFVGGETGATKVSAICQRDESGRDHGASVSIEFGNGAKANIFVSNREHRARKITVEGEAGSAEATSTLGAYGKGTITLNGELLHFTPIDPYEAELRDFVSAVREGRDPKVSGAIGLANVEILSQIS